MVVRTLKGSGFRCRSAGEKIAEGFIRALPLEENPIDPLADRHLDTTLAGQGDHRPRRGNTLDHHGRARNDFVRGASLAKLLTGPTVSAVLAGTRSNDVA